VSGLVCLGSNQGVSGQVERDCMGPSASADSPCSLGIGPLQNKKKINLTTATSIVVANMIGTGVFTSLGFQVVDIKSGFSLLLIWLIGGIFALCGALSYGELGAAFPRSGGEYNFLSRVYHPGLGFMSGWVSATVGFAAPVAAAAMALGEHLSRVIPSLDSMVIALVVVGSVSGIHTVNVKLGSYFQNIFTGLKIVLILALVGAGLVLGESQGLSFMPSSESIWDIPSMPFAVSLVFVMYSYSGWNASTYIAGEVQNPQRNIPRSLFIGTALVTALYLSLNLVFLYTTTLESLANEVEVGFIVANSIFGESGGKIMAGLISLALISSISSMVWAGPRVTQVIGEDIPFFRMLARKNREGIPFAAIVLQMLIAGALVITATFETVITYTTYTLVLSTFITVAGVLVLRVRRPDLDRPYRTWGYPVPPLIFILISLWMLVYLPLSRPWEALSGVLTLLSGLLVYYIASRFSIGQSRDQGGK